MLSKISSILDSIADSLEAKGLLKEAYELDRIANTLDFPIPMTWTPGEYGDWSDFEGKIKEAATGTVDRRANPSLKGMLFDGSGQKRDGTSRRWDHAEATGYYFTGKDGAVMVEVKDGGQIRQLNIATFTGDAASNLAGYKFVNGTKTQTHPIVDAPAL